MCLKGDVGIGHVHKPCLYIRYDCLGVIAGQLGITPRQARRRYAVVCAAVVGYVLKNPPARVLVECGGVCGCERGCVWLCVAGCTGVLRVVCVFMCVYVCWCVVVLGHESNIDNSHAGPLR